MLHKMITLLTSLSLALCPVVGFADGTVKKERALKFPCSKEINERLRSEGTSKEHAEVREFYENTPDPTQDQKDAFCARFSEAKPPCSRCDDDDRRGPPVKHHREVVEAVRRPESGRLVERAGGGGGGLFDGISNQSLMFGLGGLALGGLAGFMLGRNQNQNRGFPPPYWAGGPMQPNWGMGGAPGMLPFRGNGAPLMLPMQGGFGGGAPGMIGMNGMGGMQSPYMMPMQGGATAPYMTPYNGYGGYGYGAGGLGAGGYGLGNYGLGGGYSGYGTYGLGGFGGAPGVLPLAPQSR